jgi:hypothetical protein
MVDVFDATHLCPLLVRSLLNIEKKKQKICDLVLLGSFLIVPLIDASHNSLNRVL